MTTSYVTPDWATVHSARGEPGWKWSEKRKLKLLPLVGGYLGLDGVDLTLSAFHHIHCWNEEVDLSFS